MKGGRRAWMRMDDEVDVGMEDDDDERLVKPTLSVSKGGVNSVHPKLAVRGDRGGTSRPASYL
jgi:hypothetical protein